MKILKNEYFNNIKSILKKLNIDYCEFIDNIRNNWDCETIYYMDNEKLSDEKLEEFKRMKNKDRFLFDRDCEFYAFNLVKGWLIEDIVYIILNRYTFIDYNNQDRDRKINTENNFNLNELDFKDELEGFELDVMSSFTNYCNFNNSISLGFEKIFKFNSKDVLIVLDVYNEKIAIVRPSEYKSEKIITNNNKNIYKYEMDFIDYNNHFYDIECLNENKDLFDSLYYKQEEGA